jgi:Fur family peroxide stress response transcriptional regulator
MNNYYFQITNILSSRAMKKQSNSVNVKQRFDQMLSKLKDNDFRITPQRLAVLKVLAASKDHPTVERIYETVKTEFPTTSIATIYKTVNLLKQLNEVLELGFADGSNRYDGNKPDPHPHVICVQCKKVIDPNLLTLKDMTAEIADETGFKILTHRLDFFGICDDCMKKE